MNAKIEKHEKHGISKACIYCKHHSMKLKDGYFIAVCTEGDRGSIDSWDVKKHDIEIISPRFHTCTKWER